MKISGDHTQNVDVFQLKDGNFLLIVDELHHEDVQHDYDDNEVYDEVPDDYHPQDDYVSVLGNGDVQLALGPKSQPLLYSKKAKRVDVQKLKENIWTKMETDIGKNNISFSNIVSSLDEVYHSEARKDVSVPFCFICLLHLANENNFEISSTELLNELIITN